MSETSAVSWLEAVRQVVTAVRASDVTELELANAEFSVRVRRDPDAARAATAWPPAPGSVESIEGEKEEKQEEEEDARLHRVVAPFTGVFYRSPTPSARAYVSEGDWVDADAVIGLVETMKIFNEVTADCSGRIVKFTADKGQLVHAGDALVLIEPGERATAEAEPHL